MSQSLWNLYDSPGRYRTSWRVSIRESGMCPWNFAARLAMHLITESSDGSIAEDEDRSDRSASVLLETVDGSKS